jgi:hypothetical protein
MSCLAQPSGVSIGPQIPPRALDLVPCTLRVYIEEVWFSVHTSWFEYLAEGRITACAVQCRVMLGCQFPWSSQQCYAGPLDQHSFRNHSSYEILYIPFREGYSVPSLQVHIQTSAVTFFPTLIRASLVSIHPMMS